MPGLHFFKSRKQHLPNYGAEPRALCSRLVAGSAHTVNILYQDTGVLLCSTAYGEYPIATFRTGRFSYFLDGFLYDTSLPIAAVDLDRILCRGDLSTSSQQGAIRDWLLGLDGDFVLFIRDNETEEWYCLNDALSRLPIYMVQTENETCVTREIKLAVAARGAGRMLPSTLAQYLLFGYSPGTATIFAGVERVRGASLIHFNGGESEATVSVLNRFVFDEYDESGARDETRLLELFVEACRVRAKVGGRPILGLSGGHDSRVVAAGLRRLDTPTRAYTWVGDEQSDSMETICARAVAQKLGLEWTPIAGASLEKSDMKWVAELKQGLVPAYTGWARPYFAKIVADYGAGAVYFSGDGGDKTLPAIVPARSFHSVEELAAFIIEREAICDIGTAARLCGIERSAIEFEFCNLLSSYPEKALAAKIAHFRIYERGFNWLFEGEDRNRAFLWTCTPFYSLPFFRAVMKVPQRRKRYHRFYRRFLMSLNREMADIPDANRGLAISTQRYWLRFAIIGMLERNPRILNRIKRMLRPEGSRSSDRAQIAASLLMQEISECTSADSRIDRDYLQSLLAANSGLSADALHNLLTLFMTVGGARF